MSRQKLSARDKIVQKASRDGLIEINQTKGEVSRVSKREGDFSLRLDAPKHEDFSKRGQDTPSDTKKRQDTSFLQQPDNGAVQPTAPGFPNNNIDSDFDNTTLASKFGGASLETEQQNNQAPHNTLDGETPGHPSVQQSQEALSQHMKRHNTEPDTAPEYISAVLMDNDEPEITEKPDIPHQIAAHDKLRFSEDAPTLKHKKPLDTKDKSAKTAYEHEQPERMLHTDLAGKLHFSHDAPDRHPRAEHNPAKAGRQRRQPDTLLQTEAPDKLQFSHDAALPNPDTPNGAEHIPAILDREYEQTDISPQAETHGKLHFNHDTPSPPYGRPSGEKHKPARMEQPREQQATSFKADSPTKLQFTHDTHTPIPADSSGADHKPHTERVREIPDTILQTDTPGKLQFSHETPMPATGRLSGEKRKPANMERFREQPETPLQTEHIGKLQIADDAPALKHAGVDGADHKPVNTELVREKPDTLLKTDAPGKLHFKNDAATPVPAKPHSTERKPVKTEGVREQPDTSLQTEATGKLQFSLDESAPPASQEKASSAIPEPAAVLKHKKPEALLQTAAHGMLQLNRPKPAPISEKPNIPSREPVKSDTMQQQANSDKLQFTREESTPDAQRPADSSGSLQHNRDSQLITDTPDKLQFTKDETTATAPHSVDTPNKAKPKREATTPETASQAKIPDMPEETASDAPRPIEAPSRPKPKPEEAVPKAPPKADDTPGRLQFASEEATTGASSASGPSQSIVPTFGHKPDKSDRQALRADAKFAKTERQSSRANDKLEKAHNKLPQTRKIRSQRVFNEETGKAKNKIYFESKIKSQADHLKGPLPLRPVNFGANAAIAYGHRKVFQVEHENVEIQAAHKIEMAAEASVRTALRHHKTAPYRKVAKLEWTATKKSQKLSYQKAVRENPKLKSNAVGRFIQKQKIKRQYAKAARDAKKASQAAKKVGSFTAKATKAIAGFIRRHPVAAAVIVLAALLLYVFMSLLGVATSIGGGGLNGIITGAYLAENADIDAAETAYTEWEQDLRDKIDNIETDYPDYDEYRFTIGSIGHNPHELLAYLTTEYFDFSFAAIYDDLLEIFNEQYDLTIVPTVETRYYWDDEEEEWVPYDWHVLTTTLTTTPLSNILDGRMSVDKKLHYAILMETKGGRQYAGSPFAFDWLPYVSSYYGWRADPFTGVKSYHNGIDIAVPIGTPIIAAHDGIVAEVVYGTTGYGRYITIAGDNGVSTRYAHCDTLLASIGQEVEQGDVIATSGNTGASTGPHLHYEVMLFGSHLNPIFFAQSTG